MKALKIGFALAAAMLASVGVGQAQQVVKVGYVYGSAPLSWYDYRGALNNGAMLELMSAIGKDAGFQVEFHGALTNDLISMLGAKIVDVVATNWAPTPARQAAADFSNSVLAYGEAFLVNKANPPALKTLADLKGKIVAVGTGTTYEQILKSTDGITVKSFANIADAYAAVRSGEVIAFATNQPAAAFQQKEGALAEGLAVASGYQPQLFQQYAIAVGKGNPDLLAKINKSLAKFAGDGTLKGVFNKFGVDYIPPK